MAHKDIWKHQTYCYERFGPGATPQDISAGDAKRFGPIQSAYIMDWDETGKMSPEDIDERRDHSRIFMKVKPRGLEITDSECHETHLRAKDPDYPNRAVDRKKGAAPATDPRIETIPRTHANARAAGDCFKHEALDYGGMIINVELTREIGERTWGMVIGDPYKPMMVTELKVYSDLFLGTAPAVSNPNRMHLSPVKRWNDTHNSEMRIAVGDTILQVNGENAERRRINLLNDESNRKLVLRIQKKETQHIDTERLFLPPRNRTGSETKDWIRRHGDTNEQNM